MNKHSIPIEAFDVPDYDDFTDKEKLRIDVERTAGDAWLCSKQLVKFAADPDGAQMFSPRVLDDLWQTKTNIDLLLSSFEKRSAA